MSRKFTGPEAPEKLTIQQDFDAIHDARTWFAADEDAMTKRPFFADRAEPGQVRRSQLVGHFDFNRDVIAMLIAADDELRASLRSQLVATNRRA